MRRRWSGIVVAWSLGCTPPPTQVSGPEGSASGEAGSGTASTGAGSGMATGGGTEQGTGQGSTVSSDPDTTAGSAPGSTSDATGESTDGPCVCPDGVCLDQTCVSVASCRQLEMLDTADTLPSGVYPLDPDGDGGVPPYEAYCELEEQGGGWTLVLKAVGTSPTFSWDSGLWTDQNTHQPEYPGFDRNEAKLASYVHVPFTEILLGMESPIGADPDPLVMNWLVLPVERDSMHALISPNSFVPTGAGRAAWKDLIPGSSLQYYCNREGFNVRSDNGDFVHTRIGILGNESDDCIWSDSWIGAGGRAGQANFHCDTENGPHGNFAGCGGDNGDAANPAYVAVFVR